MTFAGATAQTYSVIDFGIQGEGASAINARGVSVGTDAASRNMAFVSDGATIGYIPSLRMDDQNGAIAINDNGLVTGWSYSGMPGAATPPHAFLFDSATWSGLTDLGTLGGGDSYSYAINASGQVTGYSSVASGNEHAFLFSAGTMIDLGTLPGGTSSQGYALNDSGVVVGQANTAKGDQHAFLTQGNSMIDLGTLAGGTTGTR